MTTQELQLVRDFLFQLVVDDNYHLAQEDLRDFCDAEHIPLPENNEKKKQIEILYVARRLENLFNDPARILQVKSVSRSLERPLWTGQIVENLAEIKKNLLTIIRTIA